MTSASNKNKSTAEADDDLLTKMPSFGQRDSLVRQASIDRIKLEGVRRRSVVRRRRQLEEWSTLCRPLIQRLNDAGVELLMHRFQPGEGSNGEPLIAAGVAESVNFEMGFEAADERLRLSIIFHYHCGSRAALPLTLQTLDAFGIRLTHVETRADEKSSDEMELLVECEGFRTAFFDALTRLAQDAEAGALQVERIQLCESEVGTDFGYAPLDESNVKADEAKEPRSDAKYAWYPRHVSELDMCAHVIVKYEPTADPKHPGYADAVYIARRAQLNEIANSYKYGQAMPSIEYTALEHCTWQLAYSELRKLRLTHTSAEYCTNVEHMEAEGLITPTRIPDLAALSRYIQRRTGFELRPCGGLLSARDFLASLAFRVFQSTLYVRHHSQPNHCPEPDLIHEVLGHCPMFADSHMAQMSQEIGLMSLGATDEQIERLSTVYWFIIEFGLCREAGRLKAIGAGLISAFGELQHACSNTPRHEPFVPEVTALWTYEDSDYQPVYFVAESISDALARVREYAHRLCPRYASIYWPITRTVERLPLAQLLERRIDAQRAEQEEVALLARRVFALDTATGGDAPSAKI